MTPTVKRKQEDVLLHDSPSRRQDDPKEEGSRKTRFDSELVSSSSGTKVLLDISSKKTQESNVKKETVETDKSLRKSKPEQTKSKENQVQQKRASKKRFKKKTGKKQERLDTSQLEVTAECDVCSKGFLGRCGTSNMERHKRTVHRLAQIPPAVEDSVKIEEEDEELTDLDIVTDFYNKILLKLI